MKTVAIIPARLKSDRFPNKILQKFLGKEILSHVIEYTKKLDFVDKVVLATEDAELKNYAAKYNIDFFLMEEGARCSTERAFSFFKSDSSYDYYMTIPSDEPIIDPEELNKLWQTFIKERQMIEISTEITTLYTKFFSREDLISSLSCKLVTDESNRALYFSRALIPDSKNGNINIQLCKKHVGVFIFPNEWMEVCGDTIWDDRESMLADVEGLEQNRFIEFLCAVKTMEIKHIGFGIDEQSQISILEKRVKNQKIK